MVAIVHMNATMNQSSHTDNSDEIYSLRRSMKELEKAAEREFDKRKVERERLKSENAQKMERIKELENKLLAASLRRPVERVCNLLRSGSCPSLSEADISNQTIKSKRPSWVQRRFSISSVPEINSDARDRKAKVDELNKKIWMTSEAKKDLESMAENQSQAILEVCNKIEEYKKRASDETQETMSLRKSSNSMKSCASTTSLSTMSVESGSVSSAGSKPKIANPKSRIEKHQNWLRYLKSMIKQHGALEANVNIKVAEAREREKITMERLNHVEKLKIRNEEAKQTLMEAQGLNILINNGISWTSSSQIDKVTESLLCKNAKRVSRELVKLLRILDTLYRDETWAQEKEKIAVSLKNTILVKDFVETYLENLKQTIETTNKMKTEGKITNVHDIKVILEVAFSLMEKVELFLLSTQVNLVQHLKKILKDDNATLHSLESKWSRINDTLQKARYLT